MGCIRVDKITEYLCDPLQCALAVRVGGEPERRSHQDIVRQAQHFRDPPRDQDGCRVAADSSRYAGLSTPATERGWRGAPRPLRRLVQTQRLLSTRSTRRTGEAQASLGRRCARPCPAVCCLAPAARKLSKACPCCRFGGDDACSRCRGCAADAEQRERRAVHRGRGRCRPGESMALLAGACGSADAGARAGVSEAQVLDATSCGFSWHLRRPRAS